MTDIDIEAMEPDWTKGLDENFERLKRAALSALEAANKRADEAEARADGYEGAARHVAKIVGYEDGGLLTVQLVQSAIDELTALRSRVAELEGALTEISKQTYGTEIWMDGDERAEILGRHLVRLRSLAFTALKGASHDAG